MRRKKSKTISIVSMSFLDLLSCALGAVLLLDIMFSRAIRPGHSTETIPFAAVTVRQFIEIDGTENRDEFATLVRANPNKYLQNSLTLTNEAGTTEVLNSFYGRYEQRRMCVASWSDPKLTFDTDDMERINVEWTVVLTFLKSTKGCVAINSKVPEYSVEFQEEPGHVFWHKGKLRLDEQRCFELEALEEVDG